MRVAAGAPPSQSGLKIYAEVVCGWLVLDGGLPHCWVALFRCLISQWSGCMCYHDLLLLLLLLLLVLLLVLFLKVSGHLLGCFGG
jgi:hypothetical protein